MNRNRILQFAALLVLPIGSALGQGLPAQGAPAGTELPMRNLQIEVRQQQSGAQARSGLGASGNLVLQPGQSGGSFSLGGGSSQRQETRNISQMMLVLNGRETRVTLGNSVPVRLVQTFVRNGQVQVIPGTVLVDANSGFAARPVWRGGDTVELEIGTALSPQGGRAGVSASSASSIVAPVNEWFTLAESDDAMAQAGSGAGTGGFGQGQQQGRSQLQVQVRISVR